MNGKLFKSLLLSGVREKETIFWIFLFPLMLFTIMVLIFSNMGGEDLSFDMILIDNSGTGMGSQIIHQVLDAVGTPAEEGKDPLFKIKEMRDKEEAYILLKEQKTDFILELPEDFNQKFGQVLLLSRLGNLPEERKPEIIIQKVELRNASSMAGDIMAQIMAQVNLEAAKQMNIEIPEITITGEVVGQTEAFNYADYFFAGVLIMAFFSTGLFNMGINLAYIRNKGIFKRFACTPLKISQVMSSTIFSNMIFMGIAFVLLLIYAKLLYGVTWAVFQPESIVFAILTAMLALAFGFFVGTVSKTPNSASGLSNLMFFPMQFLGGLYFPVFDLPPAVSWFVYINPLTYLAAGMRKAMGLMDAPVPHFTLYLVPLIWAAALLLISLKLFKWDGGE
jgi:ABC-2 type transport system permease protein